MLANCASFVKLSPFTIFPIYRIIIIIGKYNNSVHLMRISPCILNKFLVLLSSSGTIFHKVLLS